MKTILRTLLPPSLLFKLRERLNRRHFDEVRLIHSKIGSRDCSRVMLDVGACHGVCLYPFARDGWHIFAFEPDGENRKELIRRCRHFPNVRIDARAVSNQDQAACPFYRSPLSDGISSLTAFHATHTQADTVETVTLARFCREQNIHRIDFLKIDAEGFDFFVLQSFPWDAIKPAVILCEFEDGKSIPLGYTVYDMADYIADKGYRILLSEWFPIIEYGGRHRWRRLVPYPARLADPHAFGNLIAAADDQTYAALQDRIAVYAGRTDREGQGQDTLSSP